METINLASGAILRVEFCDTDVFHTASQELYVEPQFTDAYTFDQHIDEKRTLEDLLRKTLSQHWLRPEDFEVGADENIAFTLCGGLYSERILCRTYFDVLHQVIRTSAMRARWTSWRDPARIIHR